MSSNTVVARFRAWNVVPQFKENENVLIEWFKKSDHDDPIKQFFTHQELLELQRACLPLNWEFRCKRIEGQEMLLISPLERCIESRLRDSKGKKGGCMPATTLLHEVNDSSSEFTALVNEYGDRLWLQYVLTS